MHSLSVSPGQDLMRQGSEADSIYFLSEGAVQVYSDRSFSPIALHKSPDVLGEVTLLSSESHTCTKRLNTYRTLTPCRHASFPTSVAVLAETSLRSPQNVLIFTIKKYAYRIKVSPTKTKKLHYFQPEHTSEQYLVDVLVRSL